jgi:hypothetical protein
MKLENYKLVLVAMTVIGILLFASPAISQVIHLPGSEPFSELYILGPKKTASGFPNAITSEQNYTIYVDVTNHLGSSAYYVLYVTFRNQTDLSPNLVSQTPSALQPLYENRFAIPDGSTWQSRVTFSFSGLTISQNRAFINTLTLNNLSYNIDKTALWDSNSSMYRYGLCFELYVYKSQSNNFSYSNLFNCLLFNATALEV